MTRNLALIANQYDHDGVDICFLGGEKPGLRLKVCPTTVVLTYTVLTWSSQSTDSVEEYLTSLRVDTVDYGETKLAEGLKNLLGKYMDALVAGDPNIKKRNFIVILGGRDGKSSGLVSNRSLIMPHRA